MVQLNREKFADIFTKDLIPVLEECEVIRKKKIFNLILWMLLCFFLGFVFYLLWRPDTDSLFLIWAILLPIVGSSLPVAFYLIFKKYLKEKCMPIVRRCSSKISWRYKMNKHLIYKNKLFGDADFDSVYFDDSFSMRYGDVKFNVAELSLYKRVKHREDAELKFRGVVIEIPTNKKIKSEVLVFSKRSIFKNWFFLLFSILFCFFLFSGLYFNDVGFDIMSLVTFLILGYIFINGQTRKKNNIKNMQAIMLEDVSFNKRFKVFATDQIEARYLLTTGFIDRFNNFKTVFGTNDIRCAFFDKTIMFAIRTNKDLFELGNLFSPVTSSKYFDDFYQQLNSIYIMIDYFKFDYKIGL